MTRPIIIEFLATAIVCLFLISGCHSSSSTTAGNDTEWDVDLNLDGGIIVDDTSTETIDTTPPTNTTDATDDASTEDTNTNEDTDEDTDSCDEFQIWSGRYEINDTDDISVLSGFVEVSGDLVIVDCLLGNLSGLECLKTIGGTLSIGLCERVGDDLECRGNPSLTDL